MGVGKREARGGQHLLSFALDADSIYLAELYLRRGTAERWHGSSTIDSPAKELRPTFSSSSCFCSASGVRGGLAGAEPVESILWRAMTDHDRQTAVGTRVTSLAACFCTPAWLALTRQASRSTFGSQRRFADACACDETSPATRGLKCRG